MIAIIDIREICKADCVQEFKTGLRYFDYTSDGTPFELEAYFEMTQSKEEPYCCYVALEKGQVIGVLCFRKVKKVVYLRRIGIKEGYQTIGNGYQLHKFLMDFVEKEKVRVIFAEAHYSVFRWFEDLGYQKVREYNDANWGKSAYMLLLIG